MGTLIWVSPNLILSKTETTIKFNLISSFLTNRRRVVVVDGKYSQEYLINAGVVKGSILGPTLFVHYINDFPDDICNIAIYADNTNLYYTSDQASDLQRQLELASEIESDLRDTGLG